MNTFPSYWCEGFQAALPYMFQTELYQPTCNVQPACTHFLHCILYTTARDEVDVKKKRVSDPVCMMNAYVDQSIKVRKLKHASTDDVSTAFSKISIVCVLLLSFNKCLWYGILYCSGEYCVY